MRELLDADVEVVDVLEEFPTKLHIADARAEADLDFVAAVFPTVEKSAHATNCRVFVEGEDVAGALQEGETGVVTRGVEQDAVEGRVGGTDVL